MKDDVKYITRQQYDKLVRESGDVSEKEVVKMIEDIISKDGLAFIKFVCQYCGSRQTSSDPNVIHKMGYKCEECGEISKPAKYGLMVTFTNVDKNKIMRILKGV